MKILFNSYTINDIRSTKNSKIVCLKRIYKKLITIVKGRATITEHNMDENENVPTSTQETNVDGDSNETTTHLSRSDGLDEQQSNLTENVQKSTKQANPSKKDSFICGVIEGFYGRPWTTEQRKDLFRKLKKWGMDSYVYAPKDDYKHRAYWRELYTVEEADHLSGLIAAAKEQGITFYYALSPGLDMTYNSQKELQTLKRKLDQVSQFGCEAFALLFDDIESELSKADKEVFQTFANAQVSVTNEIYSHLGNPKFLFCPTQYCSSRAVPSVHDSEYLNTLGSKLNHDIDIMWTGNKVISKIITLESIQEITDILRRPPVIWDNLHANDYDQKRVFLGPYSGRSPELIQHLRGVMTNPNCEFHANTIAIHTLAYWSRCRLDSKVHSSISADIKLETENDDDAGGSVDLPDECYQSKDIYHPRTALKNAINEWLPEFFIEKEAWGPITKPQPQVTMVMPIIPIIPSINTCMSLTTTTTTSTSAKTVSLPEVNTTQLQALADVCSTVNSSAANPMMNPVMNSLVSPTKVVTNDDIVNPIPNCVTSNIELPKKIPISLVSVPIMHTKVSSENETSDTDDMADNSHSNPNLSSNKTDKEVDIVEDREQKLDVEGIVEKMSENRDQEILPTADAKLEVDTDVIIDEKPMEPDSTVISNDIILEDNSTLSPASTGNEPMECSSSLTSQISPKEDATRLIVSANEDVIMAETPSQGEANNTMQIESAGCSPISTAEMAMDSAGDKPTNNGDKINADDLHLLCDLFYLPFEHGSRGSKLLNEFNWLKANAQVLLQLKAKGKRVNSHSGNNEMVPLKPEITEWLQRAEYFSSLCSSVHILLKKVATCDNKEICHDLFSYIWDLAGALSLLDAFVKWLRLGQFPGNVFNYTQGTYTWFSKGWKEAFMSGDQEPWVFRGGLIADLQRLMPVDSGNDLFLYKLPELPTTDYYLMRPYNSLDEENVYKLCTKRFLTLISCGDSELNDVNIIQLPDNINNVIADFEIGPYITLQPELCIVAIDSAGDVIGYTAAALDCKAFMRVASMSWIPEMCEKYPKTLMDNSNFTASNNLNKALISMISNFHHYETDCPNEVFVSFPAVMITAVSNEHSPNFDYGIIKRLLTVSLATLRANGCFGVHIRLPVKDFGLQLAQYYIKLGFSEVYRESDTYIYYGRRF